MKIYISPNGDWWDSQGGEACLVEVPSEFQDCELTTNHLQAMRRDCMVAGSAREDERTNLVNLLCKSCFAEYTKLVEASKK